MSVHQTAVTHSYGSTTGGFAMRDIGRGVVDDFIYTGSPGSAVQSVERLGVEPGHVYVSAVPSLDAVQGIGPDGSFGRNPDRLEGIEHLSGDTTGAQDHKNLFEFRYDAGGWPRLRLARWPSPTFRILSVTTRPTSVPPSKGSTTLLLTTLAAWSEVPSDASGCWCVVRACVCGVGGVCSFWAGSGLIRLRVRFF